MSDRFAKQLMEHIGKHDTKQSQQARDIVTAYEQRIRPHRERYLRVISELEAGLTTAVREMPAILNGFTYVEYSRQRTLYLGGFTVQSERVDGHSICLDFSLYLKHADNHVSVLDETSSSLWLDSAGQSEHSNSAIHHVAERSSSRASLASMVIYPHDARSHAAVPLLAQAHIRAFQKVEQLFESGDLVQLIIERRQVSLGK